MRQYVPPGYEAWSAELARQQRAMRRDGIAFSTVAITPDGFKAWLTARHVPADLSQLMAYVWDVAQAGPVTESGA